MDLQKRLLRPFKAAMLVSRPSQLPNVAQGPVGRHKVAHLERPMTCCGPSLMQHAPDNTSLSIQPHQHTATQLSLQSPFMSALLIQCHVTSIFMVGTFAYQFSKQSTLSSVQHSKGMTHFTGW